MAKDASFDIVSEFDKQELSNAVDQAKKEIDSRFDLKGTGSTLSLDGDKSITLNAPDDMKLRNIVDILQSKLTKRNLSIKILDIQKAEYALGGKVKQVILLKKGLAPELAKKVVAEIKESKIKVQASIQGDQVRVTGKSRDDLQEVIQLFRKKEDEYSTPLQFTNYR